MKRHILLTLALIHLGFSTTASAQIYSRDSLRTHLARKATEVTVQIGEIRAERAKMVEEITASRVAYWKAEADGKIPDAVIETYMVNLYKKFLYEMGLQMLGGQSGAARMLTNAITQGSIDGGTPKYAESQFDLFKEAVRDAQRKGAKNAMDSDAFADLVQKILEEEFYFESPRSPLRSDDPMVFLKALARYSLDPNKDVADIIFQVSETENILRAIKIFRRRHMLRYADYEYGFHKFIVYLGRIDNKIEAANVLYQATRTEFVAALSKVKAEAPALANGISALKRLPESCDLQARYSVLTGAAKAEDVASAAPKARMQPAFLEPGFLLPDKHLDSVMGSYQVKWQDGVPNGVGRQYTGAAESFLIEIDIAVIGSLKAYSLTKETHFLSAAATARQRLFLELDLKRRQAMGDDRYKISWVTDFLREEFPYLEMPAFIELGAARIAVVPKHPSPTQNPQIPPDPKFVTELTLIATDDAVSLFETDATARQILLTGIAISQERWPEVTTIRLLGQKGAEVCFDAEAMLSDNWILERYL